MRCAKCIKLPTANLYCDGEKTPTNFFELFRNDIIIRLMGNEGSLMTYNAIFVRSYFNVTLIGTRRKK